MKKSKKTTHGASRKPKVKKDKNQAVAENLFKCYRKLLSCSLYGSTGIEILTELRDRKIAGL